MCFYCSGPVFTNQNPFQPAPRVGKSHYHPSCNQSLSKKKKKTTLSPVRLNQRPSPQIHTLDPVSQQKSDKCDLSLAIADGQPVFSESWPSTDSRTSPSITATTSDMETHKQTARAGSSTLSSEPGDQQDSMLAKYIERFRHGRPQSREDRQQMASAFGEEQLPFRWKSSSSLPPSSTPNKMVDIDQVILPLREEHMPAFFSPAGQRHRDRSPSICSGSPCVSGLSDTFQVEFDDTELINLQERASRLLLRGECTLSDGSIRVSSEGLGCSDFSPTVSVDEPVRRPFMPGLIKSTAAKASSNSVQSESSQKHVFPSLGLPTRPEEDILFQWRLRRKMEQATKFSQTLQHSHRHNTFSLQPSSLLHPSPGEVEHLYKGHPSTQCPEFSLKDIHPHITAHQPNDKEALSSSRLASGPSPPPAFVVSGSSVSQHQALAHVPAHMHLLCDVLPCSIHLSHASAQQNISQDLDEFHSKFVSKKTQVPDDQIDIFTEEPIRECMSSSTHASSGAVEKEWPLRNKRSENNKKEKAQGKELQRNKGTTTSSIRKQKTPKRYTVDEEHADGPNLIKRSSSQQRPPKNAVLLEEMQQQEQNQGFSSRSCTGDRATPRSPVHSALAQVVSEVLFPTVDSPPSRRSPSSLVSPPCPVSAPQHATVHKSVKVISQLLQEAEDSDEKEFEDDTLLQVLRKQRKWVKEQIREVECMLTEFLDEQQVT
uniref:proline and serine-rich protein 3 isoform X1 n=1 Tax=Solea senegalensis TaxID=28829 RepID=UPI001CD89F7C|nr:proline and serine-rich protein 3 isoform X1 [Solea senegalensis]